MTTTKLSGTVWIDNIPSDWGMQKVKYVATLKGRIGWQGLSSDEYTDEGAYLITGTDFDNGGINWETCVHVPMKRWAEAKDIQIENGDLLITKDGTVGKVAIVDGLESPCSLNSGVLRISTKNGYDRRFLFWVLQSVVFWTWFSIKNAGNSTILHLYQGDFAEFNFAIPSLPEQRAIAAFLEDRCGYIDSIIVDLEQQVEILRQYKKVLITETVTKGLDKSAPMKDSGIVGIGQIPTHYELKKLKHIVSTKITDGPHETPDLIDDGIPFLSAESVKEGILDFNYKRGYISLKDHQAFCRKCKPQVHDIFMVKSGATTGKTGMVMTEEEFSVWSPLALIRCDDIHIKQQFVYYSMLSNYFTLSVELAWSYGTQQNIGMGVIENLGIVLPPTTEQETIVEYLDTKCAETDALITEKLRSVEIMRQYKRSLIYEYVTGKKRVAS